MKFTVGDEVRRAINGRFGFVLEVDEEEEIYIVDFDGDDMVLSEDELC